MRKLSIIFFLLFSAYSVAETNFAGMLKAAEAGDVSARILVAYTYYLGEYRDGSPVGKDLKKAYAWASLANYQGHPEANKLVTKIIPELGDRKEANYLAGEYFKEYGAPK